MSPVVCPRCRREAADLTAFCVGCGAPLLLEDHAPAGPVDLPVELDRRSRRGSGPRASELAAVERSSWAIGGIPAAQAKPEPALAPPARPARNDLASEETWNVAGSPLPGAPPSTPAPTPARAPTSTASATATATPTSTSAPATATAAGVLPSTEPAFADDLPEPEVDAVEVHVARAEPWRRAAAWALDGGPFLAGGVGLAFVLLREAAATRGGAPRSLEEVIDLLAAERVIALSVAAAVALALASYATLAHTLGGATLGKRLLALRVVGPDGRPPSPARSAFRSAFAVISAALLGLGFLLALFTRTGRSFHDLVARTWVVKAP